MDVFSKKKRSEVMSKIRGKDTKMEIVFRRALWARGFRYRKNPNRYFGKPDLVLKKFKTVIFLDSCFWHCCPKHCRIPASRKKYWAPKLERNKEIDKEVSKYWKKQGWKTIRFWEHQIKKDLGRAIEKTIDILN